MAKSPTLEDFVKNYIKNKEKSSGEGAYKAWVSERGIDSEKLYSDTVRDIEGDYHRSKSEYGSVAERLSRLGLSGSGYSDYLNGKAYSEMQRQKANAKETYAKNELSNRRGFSDYVESVEKKLSSDYKNTVSEIESLGITDENEAYELAISKGLSEEEAALVAKSASENARKKLRDKALLTILNKNYGEKQAFQYAVAVGLPEDVANELSMYADMINRDGNYSSDYLEYLKDKWAKENGK